MPESQGYFIPLEKKNTRGGNLGVDRADKKLLKKTSRHNGGKKGGKRGTYSPQV